MKNSTSRHKPTRYKEIYEKCKTEYFVFLKIHDSYKIFLMLLRVFFLRPSILRPDILSRYRFGNGVVLPDKIAQEKELGERAKWQCFFRSLFIGAFFAFLFWLPFWFLVLHADLFIWYVLASLSLSLFLLFCALLAPMLRYKHDEKTGQIFFCSDQFHSANSLIPKFIQVFLLCILIFVVLHAQPKNVNIGMSVCYPFSIAIFLFLPRAHRFFFGFFVGIFGFYWMTLSFRFEGLDFAIPFGVLFVGLVYGVLLWFLLYFQNLFCRIVALSLLFVLHPLDFNWLNVAYLSAYTVFKASYFGMLLLALAFCIVLVKKIRYLAFLLVFGAFDYDFSVQEPQLQAKIIETNYPQDIRWDIGHRENIIQNNLNAIREAIQQGYPLVVLPESAFPLLLNKEQELYTTLLALSKDIIIVAGGMRYQSMPLQEIDSKNTQKGAQIALDTLLQKENIESVPEKSYLNTPTQKEGYYNAIYVFYGGHSIVADKSVLVPFGETLPFNEILSPLFEYFFGGKFGFNQGQGIVTLTLENIPIALANCYEGTLKLPYETGAKYILMLSNNAWFQPSTQALMQQMIVKYYARSYNAFVYHATNYTQKAIITPNNSGLEKQIDF